MNNQDILNMVKELEAKGHTPTFILCIVEKVLKDNIESEKNYYENIARLTERDSINGDY